MVFLQKLLGYYRRMPCWTKLRCRKIKRLFTTKNIRKNTTIEVIKGITTHTALPFVARTISDAFKLAERDVESWTAQTRDRLVLKLKNKIPALKWYELMHLIRSLSYIYELKDIPCDQKYYDMSFHVKEAGIKLMEIGKKPNDVMNYLRDDDELGVVSVDIIPNDDMV